MRVTPNDIGTFAYCPYLYQQGGSAYEDLSLFTETARDSILAAEVAEMRRGGMFLNNIKIGKAWEKIWWPRATKAGLSPKRIEEKTLYAALKFTDYCRYDIASTAFTTIAVGIPVERQLSHGTLASEVQLLKSPRSTNDYATVISFGEKRLTRQELAADISTMATLYILQALERNISYLHISLGSRDDEVKIASCYYRKSDLAEAEKVIEYLMRGMKAGIDYRPYWTCKDCNKCRNSNY